MRAVVHDRYGPPDVLRLEDVERPVPKEGEVLVRVHATTAGTSFEEAAAVCDGVTLALMGLRPADLRKGRAILVHGASGSIGTAAVQLAKHFEAEVRDSLGPGGIYLATDGLRNVMLAWWTARIGGKRVVFPIPPRYEKQDVLFLKGLIEAGRYRAVIDRRYPLADVVEATRYVETEQKTGNVDVFGTLGANNEPAVNSPRKPDK
ncbi:zinc-binding dehydrogenase [Nonomuraea sp. NPDC026600]|uniref:zinc-binding dehydrogenase n=1 Tax=Nonomuraea sp. NPDC026600 TaxID=3155363 RepID=UPI0033C05A0F